MKTATVTIAVMIAVLLAGGYAMEGGGKSADAFTGTWDAGFSSFVLQQDTGTNSDCTDSSTQAYISTECVAYRKALAAARTGTTPTPPTPPEVVIDDNGDPLVGIGEEDQQEVLTVLEDALDLIPLVADDDSNQCIAKDAYLTMVLSEVGHLNEGEIKDAIQQLYIRGIIEECDVQSDTGTTQKGWRIAQTGGNS